MPRRNALDSSGLWLAFTAPAGLLIATSLYMNRLPTTPRHDRILSFIRVVRGFAEAALVVLAFATAIWLIGIPIALIVRGLHDGLSWIIGLAGEMSAPIEALVLASSAVGGLVIALVSAAFLVRMFRSRGTCRSHARLDPAGL